MKHVIGLVSWMGRVSDLGDFWAKMRFEEFERKGFLVYEDFVLSEKYIKDSMNYRSAEAISKLDLPVLLIYGERDDTVPPSEGLKFLKFYKGRKTKLEILEGSNHKFYGEETKGNVLSLTYGWIEKTF